MPDELSLDLFGDGDGDPAEATPRADGSGAGARSGGHEAAQAEDPASADRAEEGAPPPKVWSVHQVNRAVRGLLEDSVDPLWVGGEVGGWSRSRSGHCYFTLKDDRAQLRAVMFSREARQLPTDPEEGTRVRALGSLTLYEARGDYQLVVRRLEAEGAEGLWRLAFEKLRAALEAEGLLDPERKRPIPRHPACVGVATSATGAALRDIVTVLRRRAPWTRVLLRSCRVQGEGAAAEIAEAIRELAGTGIPDVIIVGRGGGSVEDLWAFNEEPVARAIAACPVPVVSAVGHEVDVTISDLVADARAPTPSAAAETVAPDAAALRAQLSRTPQRLGQGLRRASERRRWAVSSALDGLARSLRRRLDPARQSLDLAVGRLERRASALAAERRGHLGRLTAKLEALSPLATLARGYAVARAEDGRVLRSVDDFPPGLDFVLRVGDGAVAARSRGEAGPVEREEEVPT